MKKNVVADTSFFICNICDLKKYDLLLRYLDLYQFYAGNNIKRELPNVRSHNEEIRRKICFMSTKVNYGELFKLLSSRSPHHIKNNGEYEAIGIAIELSLTESLHCLVLDDKRPKKFVLNKIVPLFPKLKGKIYGTIRFIDNSCRIDKLIPKSQCIDHLQAIHHAWIKSQKLTHLNVSAQ